MAPLSGGNNNGPGKGSGGMVPFGGHFGPPESPGKRRASTGPPSEMRVSKYEVALIAKNLEAVLFCFFVFFVLGFFNGVLVIATLAGGRQSWIKGVRSLSPQVKKKPVL